MLKKLSKLKVNQFIAILNERFQVYAPIKKGDIYEYDVLSENSEYNFFEPTYTSFKKIIIPRRQKLYEFSNEKFSCPKEELSTIIIGLSHLDIQALNTLKKIMSKPVADSPFNNKIENTIFCAVSRGTISEAEIETDEINEGYDVLFVQAEDNFYLEPATNKGREILSMMKLPNSELSLNKTSAVEFGLFKDKETIVKALESSKDSRIWDKLSDICIGCGNCTAICPLCYCFNIEHNFSSGQKDGSVERVTDSCFFKSFAAVSGGNFREKFRDRIYHFFSHKFIQAYYERKEFNCNHCGRCVKVCPAGINIFKIIDQVVKEYERKNAGK